MVEVRFVFGKLPLRATLRDGSTAGAWDVEVLHDEPGGALVASATWNVEEMRVEPWNPETWNLGGDDYRRHGGLGDALHRLVQARLMSGVIEAHVHGIRRRFHLPSRRDAPRRGLLERARDTVMRIRSHGG
jgi:hypothetical protein